MLMHTSCYTKKSFATELPIPKKAPVYKGMGGAREFRHNGFALYENILLPRLRPGEPAI